MMSIVGGARQSQLISTYGVGSIIPFGSESFMVAGLDTWQVRGCELEEPRLARAMGVRNFRTPPTGNASVGLVTFPRMVFCPDCRWLGDHAEVGERDRFRCRDCDVELSPSRFVTVCNEGHIDDFPYYRWVHGHGVGPDEKREHRLELHTSGKSLSLKGLVIKCACGVQRNMEGAFNRSELNFRCRGKRPWLQTRETSECNKFMVAMQRGASGVWSPMVQSALTIPPWSSDVLLSLNQTKFRNVLLRMTDEDLLAALEEEFPGRSREVLLRSIEAFRNPPEPDDLSMQDEEFRALMEGEGERGSEQLFVTRRLNPTSSLRRLGVQDLVRADRLREVRALYGFQRGTGPDDPITPEAGRSQLSRDECDWLPAVEVLGEGIFVNFSEAKVKEFIDSRFARGRFALQSMDAQHPQTARMVLVHSIAHALMAEVAHYSGYPLSSLQERIFAGPEQAGVLIFTSSSDSAGSLGGLAALADPETLASIIETMVRRQSWCTSDPVCIDSERTGVNGTNMAACHACLLMPEVTCRHRNEWLDRALLVGPLGSPEKGFFALS